MQKITVKRVVSFFPNVLNISKLKQKCKNSKMNTITYWHTPFLISYSRIRAETTARHHSLGIQLLRTRASPTSAMYLSLRKLNTDRRLHSVIHDPQIPSTVPNIANSLKKTWHLIKFCSLKKSSFFFSTFHLTPTPLLFLHDAVLKGLGHLSCSVSFNMDLSNCLLRI